MPVSARKLGIIIREPPACPPIFRTDAFRSFPSNFIQAQIPFMIDQITEEQNRTTFLDEPLALEATALKSNQLRVTDNLTQLLGVIPESIRAPLQDHDAREGLIEIVMDLGREPEARFGDGRVLCCARRDRSPTKISNTSSRALARSARTTAQASSAPCTVSRPSETGRARGRPDLPRSDALFTAQSTSSTTLSSPASRILMLGRPGRGKTTKLREVARVLSEEFGKRVVIVDTSNEIAGDGDIPHPGIGRARRMQVPTPPTSTRS